MKNKTNLLCIVLLFLLTSCNSEYLIPDNLKNAFFIDCYNINDTLSFDLEKNGSNIDTLYFVVTENKIEKLMEISYLFGDTTEWEVYTFISKSTDNNNSIRFDYSSMNNLFSSEITLNKSTFSLDIIEKQIESITINNESYKNVFFLQSESFHNTYSYISNDNGIIEMVADSIKLISID